MSLSNETVKSSLVGDGVNKTFAIAFDFIDNINTETKVFVRETNVFPATEELRTEGGGATEYSIVGTNVVFVTAPTNTQIVVIVRQLPLTAPLDIDGSQNFKPESQELAYDRLAAQVQQMQEVLDRTASLKITEQQSAAPELPQPVAGLGLKWNPAASNLINTDSDPDTIAAAAAVSAAAALVSETNAATSETNAAADAVATAADAVSTAADAVATALDAIATASDVVSTNADVVSTNADAVSTAADAAATALDAIATAADAVSTAADAVSTTADAAAASTSASNAATSETNAATSETNAATSETNAAASAAAASGNEPSTLHDLGFAASVGASALTFALKQSDGSTDPTLAEPVVIAYNGPTEANGDFNLRSNTAAEALVISSGSTLGMTSGALEYLFWYGVDDGSKTVLGVSLTLFDEGKIVTTTAEGGAGAADDATVMYTTAVQTNRPIRLLARTKITLATAGTWDAVPTIIALNFSRKYTLGSTQIFEASGTWTRPEGVVAIEVEVVGGGGGGANAPATAGGQTGVGSGGGGGGYSQKFITLGLGSTETVTVGAGGAASSPGGTTSFGSHLQATGGANGIGAGPAAQSESPGGAGGIGSSGDINAGGGAGANAFAETSIFKMGGAGGDSVLGGGGKGSEANSVGVVGQDFGGGGGGAANAASQSLAAGGAGADGIIIVREFY